MNAGLLRVGMELHANTTHLSWAHPNWCSGHGMGGVFGMSWDDPEWKSEDE